MVAPVPIAVKSAPEVAVPPTEKVTPSENVLLPTREIRKLPPAPSVGSPPCFATLTAGRSLSIRFIVALPGEPTTYGLEESADTVKMIVSSSSSSASSMAVMVMSTWDWPSLKKTIKPLEL